jgi:hypothetical protein
LGWIIAQIPQAVTGGKFMTLVFYKEGLNMVIIDQAMAEQMIEVCHTAEVANRVANTVVKGFGFGDRVHKLLQQLESTDMVLLVPHHMMGHQTMDMSTMMAEFYEVFRIDKGGPSMRLLPTTMPVGILDMSLRFVNDTSDATINQNTEHMTEDKGQSQLDSQIQLKTTDPLQGGVGGTNMRAYKKNCSKGTALTDMR